MVVLLPSPTIEGNEFVPFVFVLDVFELLLLVFVVVLLVLLVVLVVAVEELLDVDVSDLGGFSSSAPR